MKSKVPNIHVFQSPAALAQELAVRVAQAAADAVRQQGCFRIALPGGSALGMLMEGFRTRRETTVNWPAWHVFWGDERGVPSDSADSNYGIANKSWLAHVPIPVGQIHAVNGILPMAEAARAYEECLRAEFAPENTDWPRFDLILLGVGTDGHTASLFPGDSVLAESRRWVMPVLHAPKPPPARVTLTLPVINHARRVFFVASGADKAPVLMEILQRNPAGASLPVQQICRSGGIVEWFIDEDAACGASSQREE